MNIGPAARASGLSKTVLAKSPPADVCKIAEDIIAKQGAEYAKLTAMLSRRPADLASMAPYHTALIAMNNEMIVAPGANVSEVCLRKMLGRDTVTPSNCAFEMSH